MKAWTRRGTLAGVRYRATMEDHEVQILHSLVSDVADLLERRRDSAPRDELAELTGIRSGHSEAPAEGPLARLLPDFHRPDAADGPDAASREASTAAQNAGMRMLHEPEILDAKLGVVGVVLRSLPSRGGTVSLTTDQAHAWTACLNDLRLSLGEMLLERHGDGRAEVPEQLPEGDPRAPRLEVYHWLTFMQDSLCSALAGGS